jgi:hypothetical protein
MTARNFEVLYKDFLALEEDLDLLEKTIQDVYFWERIRIDVHQRLVEDLHGESDNNRSGSHEEYINGLKLLVKNFVSRNPWFAPEREFLFYSKGRRKQLADGNWWDIYIDPIVDSLEESYECLERPYRVSHRRPAKTENLRYTDVIEFVGAIPEQIGFGRVSLADSEMSLLKRIESELSSRFGISIPIVDKVRSDLARRRVQLPLFRSVIRGISPEIAFLTSSYYGRETFVEACQLEGIPVIELQHGVITKYHLGYSYPDGEKRAFPDYFFAFGDFWKETVDLPIPNENVYSVGYPFLEQEARSYDNIKSTEQVVFISQSIIGEKLSQFAATLAENDEKHRIVYKLHPKEYDTWKEEYPWLCEADLDVVTDSPSLYRIFSESNTQIGVYSTALFEGLYFELDTHIVELPGHEYMDPLIEAGCAQLISGLDDYVATEEVRAKPFDKGYFFEPDSVEMLKKYTETIRNQ